MSVTDLTPEEMEELENRLDFLFHSTGSLPPMTHAELKAFESYLAEHPEIQPPELSLTAEEILQKGYIATLPGDVNLPETETWETDLKAAARNLGELSEEVLKKLKEDEERATGNKP